MRKSEIIAFSVVFLLLIGAILLRRADQNELKEHGVLINVKIDYWLPSSKGAGALSVFCVFTHEGKKYSLPSVCSYKGGADNLIGKRFPAIFSTRKKIIEVLVMPEDFRRYNLPFPDSLQWVVGKQWSK